MTISSKGQITLPSAMRKSLGVKQGDRLRVIESRKSQIVLEKQKSFQDYYGKLDGFWGGEDPAKEIRAWRDRDQKAPGV